MVDEKVAGNPAGAAGPSEEEIEALLDEPKSGRRGNVGLIILTVAGLLCAAGVALMPVFMKAAPGEGSLDVWTTFLGDLHPVMVHLPIGIVVLVLLMEVFGLLSFGHWKPQTTFPLFIGVVTAVLAAICGNYLALQGDYSAAKMGDHLWGSTVFVVVVILAYLAKIWAAHSGGRSPIYGILLLLTAGVLGYAAHEGGELTHGDPFAPVIRELKGEADPEEKAPRSDDDEEDSPEVEEPKASDRLVYQEVVVPILRDKCYACHAADPLVNPSGKKKVKGGLEMTTLAGLRKGGDEAPAVVPGQVGESLMVERISLPIDDDDHMPPESKKQMGSHELEVLKWWIAAGLPEGKTMEEVRAPAGILAAVERIPLESRPFSGEDAAESEGGPAVATHPSPADRLPQAGSGEGQPGE